jgi:hypothetical protein
MPRPCEPSFRRARVLDDVTDLFGTEAIPERRERVPLHERDLIGGVRILLHHRATRQLRPKAAFGVRTVARAQLATNTSRPAVTDACVVGGRRLGLGSRAFRLAARRRTPRRARSGTPPAPA